MSVGFSGVEGSSDFLMASSFCIAFIAAAPVIAFLMKVAAAGWARPLSTGEQEASGTVR